MWNMEMYEDSKLQQLYFNCWNVIQIVDGSEMQIKPHCDFLFEQIFDT